ncbi:MAG: methylmalonyl Co-A mutase-associated GTPase MeaB, partial [Lysobacterales bacterium]
LVLVNKADGELEGRAQRTAADYANALRLIRPRSSHWQVPVHTCSALTGSGVPEVWSLVEHYRAAMSDSGEHSRGAQNRCGLGCGTRFRRISSTRSRRMPA